MGLITGACSGGVFVIDLDLYKNVGAQAWLDEMIHLQQRAGELDTAEQITGGGGVQLFFRAPPGWTPPTCKTSIGIDIRGQGGFAMMPPSMHQSGNLYRWKEGHEPWEIGFTVAPAWLCEQISLLAKQHLPASSTSLERTPTPGAIIDGFGFIVDGREGYATGLVWAAVLDVYRSSPITPPAAVAEDLMYRAYALYEQKVKSRIHEPNTPQAALLEREGRGLTMFREKWRYAMAQWDTKVCEHANNTPAGGDFDTYPTVSLNHYAGDNMSDGSAHSFHFVGIRASDVKPILSNFWLIKGVLPKKGLAIVYGAPGSGKSFFVADLVAHISAPHLGNWRGHKTATGDVAYCFLEGGFAAQNRVAALRSRRGDLGGFYSYPYSMNLSSRPAKSQQYDAQATQADAFNLVASIRGQQESVACVVVDTLSRAMSGGDENSSKDMTAFISAMDYIAKELDCLVIVVHHNGKDQSKGARGHSSLLAAVDTEIEITRPSKDLPCRNAKMTKLKEGGDGKEFPFELEIYSLGFDEDGDEVTTCLIVPTDADPTHAKAKAVRLGTNETVVLKAYETFQCDFPDKYTPIGTGFPDKPMKCVEVSAFKTFSIGRMSAPEKTATRQVREAINSLTVKHVLALNGGLLWRVR